MITSDQAFDIIEKVASLSGNSKQEYLRLQDPGIQRYLLAAYNPYTMYYLTKCSKGTGNYCFDNITWQILNELSTRKLSGNGAQIQVNIITKEMTKKSAELFQRILKKDLRMGIGPKTINKVFPRLIPTHDVMLAKLYEKHRVKYPCFGSPKVDGLRGIYRNGKFYSRNGHELLGLTNLKNELSHIDQVIDGELAIPNMTFQKLSGLLRNHQEIPFATFHIFELPEYNGPFIERLTIMKDMKGGSIVPITHLKLKNENELMNFYNACRNIGYEGSVVKPLDYQYKGTRNYDWMKVKPVETIDLKVIGIYEGQGKYKDQMGGVEVLFKGKLNRVGGGWSDKEREFFWNNSEEILNRIIEVDYMEETDDGNMRHARKIKFREDK